jgi:molybdopterin-containing oxidoreductase family iron-sulfur binding subunit
MSATAEHEALKARLRGASPAQFWRSLDELAGKPEFQRFLDAEFPAAAARLTGAPDRRRMLKLMGASLLMGGLAACHPARQIVPYVRQPEAVVPGRKRYYATTLNEEGYGFGVLAESHEGRPTKIEGNPHHPASLGATDAILQAGVLGLYDPDRARTPTKDGVPAGYTAFLNEVAGVREALGRNWGKGLAVLIGPETSPTLAAQLEALRAQFPAMRLFRHAPLAAPAQVAATAEVFGPGLVARAHVDKAAVVVSLDADFLGEGPGKLAYARAFADARRVTGRDSTMSRLYAFASTPSLTSAKADHVRRLKASGMGEAIEGIATRIAGQGGTPDPLLDRLAADLEAAGPQALVLAGSRLDQATQAAALRLNARLGAIGGALDFIASPEIAAGAGDLYALAEAIDGGTIEVLIVLGGDPAYAAPGDLDLPRRLRAVPFTAYWGLYADDTATACHWHLPAAHSLESWGDAVAFEGTHSIVQPLIAPLYGGKTIHEIVAALLGQYEADARGLVRAHWAGLKMGEAEWAKALRDGVVAGTAARPVAVAARPSPGQAATPRPTASRLELNLVPDPYFRDGGEAGNVWLMELPRPLTKIVWGNAVQLSAATAGRLGVAQDDLVAVTADGRTIEAPVWIEPGQPDDSLTLSLGFGRRTGSAAPVGADAYRLRGKGAEWHFAEASLRKLGRRQPVVTTQHHHAMEGRDIIRTASLADFQADPGVLTEGTKPAPAPGDTLYPPYPNPEEAWGMVIDTGTCIGCMACVQACQAENNSPVVGPEQVALGREMHWLRVDRYYEGDPLDPHTHFQPVPCMQCEDAPCEVVCPVNATVHTHDGLNAQVYNRCVGTRYCSQNCPYKVRRFNFYQYQDFSENAPLAPLMNPNVSVRERGVMEKCTYCIQRISAARIESEIADRPIPDGGVVTACQQACPTRAITFGNLNDPDSAVNKAKAEPHNYVLLAELNTRPRTSYLADIRNPNPAAKEGKK